jgi:hypothetical protein
VDPTAGAEEEDARAPSTRKFLQKLKDRESARNLDIVQENHSEQEYSDYDSEDDERYSIRKQMRSERAELQQVGMIPPEQEKPDPQFFAPID